MKSAAGTRTVETALIFAGLGLTAAAIGWAIGTLLSDIIAAVASIGVIA